MRRPLMPIPLLIVAALWFGCASFWIDITIEPLELDSRSVTLSGAERKNLEAVVSDTSIAFGLTKSSRVEGETALMEVTGGDEHWTYQILALYERADKETGYSRVEVEVRRSKSSNAISVHIIDRDGRSYEQFTKDLEAALRRELMLALPAHRIVAKRR